MKLKQLAAGVAASTIMLAAGAASAATLSLAPGTGNALAYGSDPYDTPCAGSDVTTCYNPSGPAGDLEEDLTTFDGINATSTTPGLLLDEGTLIEVTFLGKEAGAQNYAFSLGGTISNWDAIGSSYITYVSAGTLDFSFSSNLGTVASNDGTFVGDAAIGFSSIYDNGKTVYAFFDDSGANGDRDFDDMVVRISVVPLPAGGLLLLTALGGFAAARRKKKAA